MLYNGNDLVLDFLTPSGKPVYYSYNPSRPKFTFTVNFTENDTTKVTNVVLFVKTSDNSWTPLDCFFSEKNKCWTTSKEFGSSNLPVNVSLDYDVLSYGPISRQSLTNAEFDYAGLAKKQEVINSKFSDFASLFESGKLTTEKFEEVFNELVAPAQSESKSITEGLGLNELIALAEEQIEQSENYLDDPVNKAFASASQFMKFDLNDYGTDGTLETKSSEGLTIEQLLNRGFEKIDIDDKSDLYYFISENLFEIVDFKKKTHTILSFKTDEAATRRARAIGNSIQSLNNMVDQFKNKFSQMSTVIGNINEAIALIPSFFETKIINIGLQIEKNKEIYKSLQKLEGTAPTLDENLKISEKISKLKGENIRLGKERAKLTANLEGVMKAVEKVTAIVSAFLDAYSMGSNASDYINLWYEVPNCPCNMSKSEQLQNDILKAGLRCGGKDLANIIGDLVTIHSLFGSVTAAPATGGTSLIVGVATIGLSIVKGFVNNWADKEFEKERALFSNRISSLIGDKTCTSCPNPEPEPTPTPPSNPPKQKNPKPRGNGGNHPSGNPDGKPSIDPSGYVYEAVSSNRVEGVTATAYYKETVEDMYGDLHENIVKWDAEEYAQENPLFTDEDGMYAWDVPQGLWQVKFEKEGYETTYSEWLPVPPPQLDINIPMKQNVQPVVKSARAFQDAVEFEFDKYMMPELLTTENITVMVGKKAVTGTIKLLNEEVSREGETETFASKVRFNAAKPFEGTEVTLMVSNRVKSYAGIRMQDDFSQRFTIEEEVRQIDCKELVKAAYGHGSTVSVAVLPASAAAGKTLRVQSSSAMILSTDAESLVLDKNGKAEIKVHGELPGTAALTFSVDGYDLTATTTVNVVTILLGDVNGDGEVNAADIVVLQNYLSDQKTVDVDESAADADGDGSITDGDVLAIVAIILNKR